MTPQELQQYIKIVTEALAPFGQKVQVASGQYYDLAYRQCLLNGWRYLIASLFFALFGAFMIWILKGYHDTRGDKDYNSEEAGVGIAVGSVMVAFCIILFLVLGYQATDYLLNPQYQAIQMVLDSVHK